MFSSDHGSQVQRAQEMDSGGSEPKPWADVQARITDTSSLHAANKRRHIAAGATVDQCIGFTPNIWGIDGRVLTGPPRAALGAGWLSEDPTRTCATSTTPTELPGRAA